MCVTCTLTDRLCPRASQMRSRAESNITTPHTAFCYSPAPPGSSCLLPVCSSRVEADECGAGSEGLLFACLCLSICVYALGLEAVCVCVCVEMIIWDGHHCTLLQFIPSGSSWAYCKQIVTFQGTAQITNINCIYLQGSSPNVLAQDQNTHLQISIWIIVYLWSSLGCWIFFSFTLPSLRLVAVWKQAKCVGWVERTLWVA